MATKQRILAIIGSASKNSSNHRLVNYVSAILSKNFDVIVFDTLRDLPHFNPELSSENTPKAVEDFRQSILDADGVFICTPEYIFSIPSLLKNALEWSVSTTVFDGKPVGVITASAHGQKGHEELKLILNTLQARMSDSAELLIQGIKGKIDLTGKIRDVKTEMDLENFATGFTKLINARPRANEDLV
jgi:chromate reductase, NAD(P)H dehydrogenase (quinone)